MEKIKMIKEQLVSQVCNQMGDLKKVDAKELGEVVDMIKDLSETLYYCEIYKQMEEAESQPKERNNYYYTERYYRDPMYYRDMDRDSQQRMYYGENSNGGGQSNGSTMHYTESEYPISFHDAWEGRSPIKRKMYMESKATHQTNNKLVKDLESYMTDLTSDIVEMLDKATPEEKAVVQRKIDALSTKIQNV